MFTSSKNASTSQTGSPMAMLPSLCKFLKASTLAGLLGGVFGGCIATETSENSASLPFSAVPYVQTMSVAGRLQVSAGTAPSQPPVRGVNDVGLTVTNGNGQPQDGLELTVVPWMPNHGHGASVVPRVEPQGEGRYLLRNVSFFMPGRWELRLATSGTVSDTALLIFDVP